MSTTNSSPVTSFDGSTLATVLRDVFAARYGATLAAATARCLALQGRVADTQDPELEYAFNRLFIGPQAPPAPVYASVYLEREPQIMGKSTLEVRELCQALGLRHAEAGHVPDDHLALELDLWLALETLCHNTPDSVDSAKREALHAARQWLVEDHMARWIPSFLERAENAFAGPPALGMVLQALYQWLEAARSGVSHKGVNA